MAVNCHLNQNITNCKQYMLLGLLDDNKQTDADADAYVK